MERIVIILPCSSDRMHTVYIRYTDLKWLDWVPTMYHAFQFNFNGFNRRSGQLSFFDRFSKHARLFFLLIYWDTPTPFPTRRRPTRGLTVPGAWALIPRDQRKRKHSTCLYRHRWAAHGAHWLSQRVPRGRVKGIRYWTMKVILWFECDFDAFGSDVDRRGRSRSTVMWTRSWLRFGKCNEYFWWYVLRIWLVCGRWR